MTVRPLAALVALNLAASAAHYADEIHGFATYPEPPWITAPGTVALFWVAITLLLAAGWWMRTHGRRWIGRVLLFTYSFLGMAVLGHYRYGSIDAFTLGMHAFIWLEAAAAMALMLWVIFDALLISED